MESAASEAESSYIGVFPEVVWRVVFKHLASVDYVNTMRTSASMRQIAVGAKRPGFIITQHLERIMEGLKKEDILNCRLVCKLWKKAVDYHVDRLPLNDTGHRHFDRKYFSSTPAIDNFLDATRGHSHLNPIIGRNVSFSHADNSDDFWQSATRFLQRFGSEIWYIALSYNANRGDYLDWLLPHLKNCLEMLPNLKTLNIHAKLDGTFDTQDVENADKKGNKYFKTNHFPQLGQLRTFVEAPAVHDCIINELLQNSVNNDVLKTLSVKTHAFDQVHSFPNLTYIKLSMSELCDFDCLKNIDCPLKILLVESSEDLEEVEPLNLQSILSSLQSFGTTLEELHLHISVDGMQSDDSLHFNKLRVIHVIHYTGKIQQFQQFCALQKLILSNTWNPITEGYSEERVAEYEAYLEGQHEPSPTFGSNVILEELQHGQHDIWRKTDQLKTIWCCGYKFTRHVLCK